MNTEITRTDVRRGLKAYGQSIANQAGISGSTQAANVLREACAMEAAKIWAQDISPAFRGGFDTSIMAANNSDTNLQTLSGTFVVQRALELLPYNYPFLTAVTSDFSAERMALDQEVTTRKITIPAVKAYSAVTGWEDSTMAATDVHITINKHVGVPLTFSANQVGCTLRNLFDEFAPAASAALAKDMMLSLYALVTSGNFTNSTVCQRRN